jgi:uncharacterized MAPEG superfamily protein
MSIELTLLIWSTTLFGFYLGVQSLLYRYDVGIWLSSGPRDEEPDLRPLTRRADKALRNLIETYGVFVALAVAIELSGRSDAMTQWGANLYFWARWAYLPAYLSGIRYLRSMIWLVIDAGLILMFFGVLF